MGANKPLRGGTARIAIAAATALATMTGASGAQDACGARMEAVDWKTVVPKPMPPEKTVAEEPDAGINPATPADTSKPPFSLAGRFLSSVGKDRRYCTAQFVDRNMVSGHRGALRARQGRYLA